MKFSELSYREYLAIDFLPAFMRHSAALGETTEQIAENTAKFAFAYADAFLRVAGQEYAKVAEAERRTEKAEAQVSLLLNMNEDGNIHLRIALLEIWEFIGVKDQTAAMEALRARRADRP